MLGAALVMSGCAIMQKTPDYPPLSPQQQTALQERRQALAGVDRWEFLGRLSLRTEKEAWTGKVRWRQTGEDFRLHISAPTGQGAIQLMSNPQFGVEVRTAEGDVQYADDAETLLYNHTGWRLPVSGLRLWVIGLPQGDDAIAQLAFDEQGQIQALEQFQWRVDYLQYRPVGDLSMPRKITLHNDQLDLRIVIDEWTLL